MLWGMDLNANELSALQINTPDQTHTFTFDRQKLMQTPEGDLLWISSDVSGDSVTILKLTTVTESAFIGQMLTTKNPSVINEVRSFTHQNDDNDPILNSYNRNRKCKP